MFKNIIVYKLNPKLKITKEVLEEFIPKYKFVQCAPTAQSSIGFVPYAKGVEDLIFEERGMFSLTINKEDKILPSNVINEYLEERVEAYEDQHGKKPKKTEKAQMKDQIIAELLPRAFSKYSKTQVCILPEHNYVIVSAGSAKKAEDTMALIRKAIGTFPVTPLTANKQTELVMTEWVKEGVAVPELTVTDEIELKSSTDEGVVTSKKQDLQNQEILNHIQSGKLATKLSLIFKENISFVLNSDLHIKRIKFTDIVQGYITEDLGESDDKEAKFRSEFFIEMSEIISLLKLISTTFECVEAEDAEDGNTGEIGESEEVSV